MEKFRLLAIASHPDDETFFFGGTLAHYALNDVDTHLLVATDGEAGKLAIVHPERGVIGYRTVEPSEKLEYLEARHQECLGATNVLGILSVSFLHLADKGLDLSLVRPLIDVLTVLNPHVILTFSETGSTYHPDHAVTGIAIYCAIKELIKERSHQHKRLCFRRLYHYNTHCSSFGFQHWAEIKTSDGMGASIDVADVQKIKLNAAQQYRTQSHLSTFFLNQQFLQTPTEDYILRINVGELPSRQNDLFADITKDSEPISLPPYFSPLPLPIEAYQASDQNYHQFLKNLLSGFN